jgi:thiol-disulfide isomerase/thioredoxin
MAEILTEIGKPEEFGETLKENPGYIIVKFGATWCAPCNKIADQVHNWMEQMPDNVICYIIDIDECFELYAHFKAKKMVSGIPTIMAWKKGNIHIAPDHAVASSKATEVDFFFNSCLKDIKNL